MSNSLGPVTGEVAAADPPDPNTVLPLSYDSATRGGVAEERPSVASVLSRTSSPCSDLLLSYDEPGRVLL